MELKSRELEGWIVLTPDVDRLDAHIAEAFKRCLFSSINSGAQHLVLDLSRVQFLDSSGLGAIVHAVQRLGIEGRLAIASPTEAVALMLELTHMDEVLTIVSDVSGVLEEAS